MGSTATARLLGVDAGGTEMLQALPQVARAVDVLCCALCESLQLSLLRLAASEHPILNVFIYILTA